MRMVTIPGINDDEATIEQFARFLRPLGILKLNLLPLHKNAEGKYCKLNQEFLIDDLEVPDEAKMKWWKEEYEKRGFTVKIGG